MNKKIVKVLALSCMLSMLFGMNVFAAPSTDTNKTNANDTAATEAAAPAVAYAADVTASNKVVMNGIEFEAVVTVAPVTNAVVAAADYTAKTMVSESASVLKAFDVSLPAGDYSAGVQVTMNVPNVVAGQKIAVLHQKADGTWESLKVNDVSNGSVTATFTSFSPVAIVAYDASPKTGSAFPVVMVLAVLAFAGAAVCYRKYSLN